MNYQNDVRILLVFMQDRKFIDRQAERLKLLMPKLCLQTGIWLW